jgi:toxin ParE1/3/4
MTGYRISKKAQADIREAMDYLSQGGEETAIRWVGHLIDRCESLVRFPESGRRRDDLAAGLRQVLVDRWLVFYQIEGDRIGVVRVLHGSRDLPSHIAE